VIVSARFPYLDAVASQPGASLMPLVPIRLSHSAVEVEATGLLDTGAAVNVLPYSIGRQLGLIWEEQRTPILLSGNLARLPARGAVVSAMIR
jgi:hypothetical protein